MALVAAYVTQRPPAWILVLSLALWLAGCSGFNPQPLEQINIHERAETQGEGGLRVSVAVLSREEAARVFGVNLQKHAVQPVWLEIENRSSQLFWFMMHGLDPNYYSANEVAYMNHKFMQGKANREMDRYFSELGIEQRVAPGETVSGFAFASETIGTKEIRVQLYGNKVVHNFEFFVTVPGSKSVWEHRDFKNLYAPEQLNLVETEEQLHAALLALACCTRRANGSGRGAPINAVFIGMNATLKAMIKAGWDQAELKKYDISQLFGSAYFDDRLPDLQFSKTRRRIDSTNRVLLWLSPIRFKGREVLVGSVSRSIDPNVDESLIYLAEDLVTARTIIRWGYVGGVGEVSKDKPRSTFVDSPYWTKGNRLVLEMSETPVDIDKVELFTWDWKGRRSPLKATVMSESGE